MKRIATIHTDFPAKFGIPRQSGLVPELTGEIVFEAAYRNPQALLGIEEYSHIWLIWEFSSSKWSATVHPPRLGGKEKRGVFATRSPFRPNPIGLSCVKLDRVIWEGDEAPKLLVSGVDLLDNTPIYDIKPYLPYADAHPEARGGFGELHKNDQIDVIFPESLLNRLPKEKQQAAVSLLAQDPRAAYQKQPGFVYGLAFAGFDIRFRVENDVLVVCDVLKRSTTGWKNIK